MHQQAASRPSGSLGGLERPRYFPRQLITPDELTSEADYFRDRLRRHNVYLHGWGVVCGALVCVVPAAGGGTTPWVVAVQPGYVLGPYGDEIAIGSGCEVSLQGVGTGGSDDLDDPWCSEVYVEKPDGPRYVAVRYCEHQIRPVRAQPAGCGCDETPCEYSRYRDGYEIGILDACPDLHRSDGDDTDGGDGTGNPTCPDVPRSPWVVLAKVTLDEDGTVTGIDNCACRRIVASARDDWYTCASTSTDYPSSKEEKPTITVPETEPTEPKPAKPAGDGPTEATGTPATDTPATDTPAAGTETPVAQPKPKPPTRSRRRRNTEGSS